MRAAEISSKRSFGEEEAIEEEKKWEEMRRSQIFSQLSSLIGLYKEKKQSQR